MTTAPLLDSTLTDTKKQRWTVGAEIGRGVWGRSHLVYDEKGRVAVLKVPLTGTDFGKVPDREALGEACAACCEEQIALLKSRKSAPWPKLMGVITLDDGRRGYVMPRYPRSLVRSMYAGTSLEDTLRTVAEVGDALASMSRVHGNLRPSNVLFDGEGKVVLADLATPALRPLRKRLVELAGGEAWAPPEARSRAHATWDTWAMSQVIHAASHALAGVDPPPPPRLAAEGLDRDGVQALKQRVLTRLGDEETNPRFRARVADRLGALLSRALSPLPEPSPPYRFANCEEFTQRVRAVHALVRPHVEEVGRILFPGIADDATFRGGEPVEYTVTVACTHGVTDHEDIVCGLQLVDLDATGDGRLSIDAQFDVQVQPSGRLRFKLGLPEVPPGRYCTKAAFAVRDSGDEPVVVTAELEVRPPPGYVPPRTDMPPSALPFPVRPIAETSTLDDEMLALPPREEDEVDEALSARATNLLEPDDDERTATSPVIGTALAELSEPHEAELEEPDTQDEPIDDPPSILRWPISPQPPSIVDVDEPVLEPIVDDDDVVTPLPVPPPPVLIDELDFDDEAPTPLPRLVPLPPPPPLPELRPVEALSNSGEDLPNWREKAAARPTGWWHRVAVAAKQDSTWAVAMAIVSSVSLVVAVSLLARAC